MTFNAPLNSLVLVIEERGAMKPTSDVWLIIQRPKMADPTTAG
jgi:hypothetical protein